MSPGLSLRHAPGHTAGHRCVLLDADGERVLFAGDLLHFTFQLNDPAFRAPGDEDPEEASRTRAAWLDRAESEGLTLATRIVPPSPIGRIVREGGQRAAPASLVGRPLPGRRRSSRLRGPRSSSATAVRKGTPMRRLRALAVAALLFALLPVSGARAATIWIWPSSAPCDTTLQACLDNAASGDEVQIAQDGLINEQDTITDKSLTLRPAIGFAPEINGLIVRTMATITPVDVLVSHVQVAHTRSCSSTAGPGPS